MTARLWIPGEPVAKGRPRLTMVGGKPRVFTPKETRDAEELIANLWRSHRLTCVEAGIPVRVIMQVFMERPASHFRKGGELSAAGLRSAIPVKRPDLDNIVKLVLDGLNGVAFADDSQVCGMKAERWWADEVHPPGVGVIVAPVASDPIVRVVGP